MTTKTPQAAPEPNAIRVLHRMGKRAVAGVRLVQRSMGRPGVIGSSALLLPGLCTRIALRDVAARLVGCRIRHSELTYQFGGIPIISGHHAERRQAFILLAPSAALVIIGMALALPLAFEAIFLGVNAAPRTFSQEGTQELVIRRMIIHGTFNAFALWCALSCWYASILGLGELRGAVASLRATGWKNPVCAVALIALTPFRVLVRILDPINRNIKFLSGAASILIWAVVTLRLGQILFG